MERTLQVRYAPPGAPARLYMLQVSPVTSVAQIKLELLVEFGIDLPLQKLMSGNTVLEDENTIEELKLSDRDVLTLINLADDLDDMPGLIDTPDHSRQSSAANQSAGAGDKPAASGGGAAGSEGGETVRKDGAVHKSLPLDTGSVVIVDSDDEEDGLKRRANEALVGLRNQGATCYLNVLVQVLYLTPEFRAMLYALPTAPRREDKTNEQGKQGDAVEKIEAPKDELIYQLQVLFAQLQAGVNASASTEGLTRSFGWSSNEVGVQHDVHELNRVLCDRLEELMRALPPDAPAPPYNIAALYRGVLCSTVKCQHCGYSSGRDEEVYDVPLVVKGHADVYQCLDAFTAPELLHGDNAYSCERCAVKRPATRALAFRTLPSILNVQLLRFEYEPSTGRREKVAHTVLFPQLLVMDKYMLPPAEGDAAAEAGAGEALQAGEQEAAVRGRVLYELQAVLVHCGTASVGHYLAFVYHLEQRRWFRFNDETVTPLDAADIFAHRWLEGGGRAEFGLAQALTQPVPYMLVYRRRAARVLPRLAEQEEGVERVALAPMACVAVPDESIPRHIHALLVHDAAKRAAQQLERKQARETVTVTVFRNRTWLPSISVRAHPLSTLEMLRVEIIAQAELLDEQAILLNFPLGGGEARYRLRRMVLRENDTTRPGNLFTAADESSTLEALRVTDKRMIYLEQDNVGWPEADASEEAQVGRVFVTVRRWDERSAAPADLADVLVPKRSTVGAFKELIAHRFRLGAPDELLLVEEETEEKFGLLLDEHLSLEQCGIRTGDIVYAERITERSYRQGHLVSQVQEYRMARRNQLEVWFEETHASFRARTKPGAGPQLAAEWRDKRARVGCTTYGGNSVAQVKDFVATRLGIGPDYLRIRALDPKGVREARLIKEPASVFAAAVTFGQVCATELQLIVLPAPEQLRKGDKILDVRFYNDSSAFVLTADVVLNKHTPLRDLKRQLAAQFGVPAERQLLSEWYDNRLYQVFANENISLAQYRIRSGDVLRLDALPADGEQVGGPEAAVALQVCVGAGWDLTASGHKELNFVGGPYIITCRVALTRGDFEELLRVRCKLPAGVPMRLFRVSRLPIIETDIRPFAPLPARALDATSAALVSSAASEALLPLRVYDVHSCDILAVLIDLPRTFSGPSAGLVDPTSASASHTPPPDRPKETSLVIK